MDSIARALEEKKSLASNIVTRAKHNNSENVQYFQDKLDEIEKKFKQ
ncbi:hypothetical protein [Legionella sp. WA2022007384]